MSAYISEIHLGPLIKTSTVEDSKKKSRQKKEDESITTTLTKAMS